MANKDESGTASENETENYLGLNLVRVPKKNHYAIEQIGRPFSQWFKKQGVKTEIYHLSSTSTNEQEEASQGLESIEKSLSIKDDEEIWLMLQFYRDRAHADEVMTKMMKMQDESMSQLMKEFDGLTTQGSNLIMGGFSRLRM